MKNALKITALSIVLVMALMMFASCGVRLSGEYCYDGLTGEVVYEFDGDKCTVTRPALIGNGKTTYEYTYEIEDDTITFTAVSEDAEDDDDVEPGEPKSFEKGSDWIKIDGITMTKKK